MCHLPLHFDMETSDPDDVMTLAVAATHPRVRLVGISITPGGPDQVGLVEHVLSRLGVEGVPVGGDPERDKPSVSEFHHEWLGRHDRRASLRAADVLDASAALGATLLTGAPLKNLARIPRFHRWIAQGGFAGDSVVPAALRLPKFEGRETCGTFNFNGAPKVALAMLASPDIKEKKLVSKNVCHGLPWDRDFQERVDALSSRTPGLDLVREGMALYLQKRPEGKLLHDPLAFAVALDPSVCRFERVEVYREKGEWGSRLAPGSDVEISIDVDRAAFFRTLSEAPAS